jgi:hypothetical protein
MCAEDLGAAVGPPWLGTKAPDHQQTIDSVSVSLSDSLCLSLSLCLYMTSCLVTRGVLTEQSQSTHILSVCECQHFRLVT